MLGHISDNDLAKAKDQQTRLKVWQERIRLGDRAVHK